MVRSYELPAVVTLYTLGTISARSETVDDIEAFRQPFGWGGILA